MPKFIDDFLNKTTMYRLVLYYLLLLLSAAVILSAFGLLSFSPIALLASAALIVAVSFLTNLIFAKVFEAQANTESVYITALILTLIITPPNPSDYLSFLPFAISAAVLAMASKFILAIGKKHLFNPASIAVALTAFAINESATWWVGGNLWLAPFVILGGLLVVRKIRRTDLVISFFTATLITIAAFTLSKGGDVLTTIWKTLAHSPIFFFAFVILTEPLTSPPTKNLRLSYAAIVGFLFTPMLHFGSIYSTPELAIIIGNIFSYLVSPKEKLVLRLKAAQKIAADTYDFIFTPDKTLSFKPGQYLEWTLGHDHPDNRGNRRYFTIASSPTETDLHLGAKFYAKPSSFKKTLAAMTAGDKIFASQLAGDFVLPKDKNEKLVFIAGGIGITPFRSMIKYLLDKAEKRSVTLFYSNKTTAEIAYQNLFNEAARRLNLKTVYTLSDQTAVPPDWQGERGSISQEMITSHVPDYSERTFYISGPHAMVVAYKKTLKTLGLKNRQIKTDFFPGFV